MAWISDLILTSQLISLLAACLCAMSTAQPLIVCFRIRVRTLQKVDAQERALLTPLSTMNPSILDDSLGALFIAVITSGVYVTLSFYSPAY
jgi:hypothetical protein